MLASDSLIRQTGGYNRGSHGLVEIVALFDTQDETAGLSGEGGPAAELAKPQKLSVWGIAKALPTSHPIR